MSPQKLRAMTRLHEALPPEAVVGVSYSEWAHSSAGADGLRLGPENVREAEEWAVSIRYGPPGQREYLHAVAGRDLDEAVEDSIRDFEQWLRSWKRDYPHARAKPPQIQAARSPRRRKGREAL